MERRDFLKYTTLFGAGIALSATNPFSFCTKPSTHSIEFKNLVSSLLKDWCDGMLKCQINQPSDKTKHGLLVCPACQEKHARCMDAVYPFLRVAKDTGDEKYLKAGIAVFEWADENVSLEDGSWTNALDPKSWNGTTVFGAIALAEAIHYHGDLLEQATLNRWTNRLGLAAEYIYNKFDLTFTNINYGATAIYALNLIGRVLKNDKYISRSRQLGNGIKPFFTEANHFLWGEGKPSDKISRKGLPVVDLGYNIEESLNSIAMYALHENDKELLDLVSQSLETHLEFMFPDGGWDNSWGTRQYKWSYWGSRTCDGCSVSYGMMAHKNPAFGTAAFRNTELLRRCTSETGLLYGGLHYASQKLEPCIHHTFTHAKPLTSLLDHWETLPPINTKTPLPRATACGVKYFEELDTVLLAQGKWRATVTAYDAIYKDGDYKHPTGGAVSALYHESAGLLLAGSMAIYKLVEFRNQQPQPGEDFALTPRVETFIDDCWYSNLFDLSAQLTYNDNPGVAVSESKVCLKDKDGNIVKSTAANFKITHACSANKFAINISSAEDILKQTSFILPIISTSSEQALQVNEKEIRISKGKETLVIKANVPLKVKGNLQSRIFNMVPGVEALPIIASFNQTNRIEIEMSMIS